MTKVTGPLSYEVKTENRDIKCHIDHLVRRELRQDKPFEIDEIYQDDQFSNPAEVSPVTPRVAPTPEPITTPVGDQATPSETIIDKPVMDSPSEMPVVTSEGEGSSSGPLTELPLKQRLRRAVKPPAYLKDFVNHLKGVLN